MISNEAPLVTEKQIITPLELVLNEVTPTVQNKESNPSNTTQTIKKSLDELFPEQQYEKKAQKAKEILGSLSKQLNPAELRDVIAETEFLVGWMISNGKYLMAKHLMSYFMRKEAYESTKCDLR